MLVFNEEKKMNTANSVRYIIHENLFIDLFHNTLKIRITRIHVFRNKVGLFYLKKEDFPRILNEFENYFDDYIKAYVFLSHKHELLLSEDEGEVVKDTLQIIAGEIEKTVTLREVEEMQNCIRIQAKQKPEEESNFEQIVIDFETYLEGAKPHEQRLQGNLDT